MTIVKTQVGGETTVTKPGNIDYEVVVTNTGNISLTNVVVSDTLPNGTVGTLSTVSENINTNNVLDTTETWTYTISYAVTQADIDAGAELINNAVVTTTELPTPKSDTARTPTSQTPSLTIVKTQVGGENPVTKPGDIDYTIVVTNTGNVSLTNVVVSDTLPNGAVGILPGATESINSNNILDTTETWTYTISYAVTQADIDAGAELVNNAVVTTTELPTPKADTARTPINSNPVLSLTKVADDTTDVYEGQLITYTYHVENKGNVTILDVNVTDVHSGTNPLGTITLQSTTGIDTGLDELVDSLAPGQVATWTSEYIVSSADIAAGVDILNTATATGTPISGILIDPTADEVLEIGQDVVAVDDEDLNNIVGTSVTLDIISNDTLSNGNNPIPTDIKVDLDPATAGIQDSLVVAGEGTFVYDTLTGEVTFTPEVGFTTDPSVINYTLIENQTGLDSTATITITYVEEPPVAVNDEDLDNVVGTTVTLNIIENDSLSDGSLIVDLTDITIDLDPATAGIQDSLVVAGEGTFVYDTLTGEVTFIPEVGFTTDPTPIDYTLIENQTGLDSTATITITYVEEPPVAVNDEDLDNVVGTTVTFNIIENDSLSDGSLIVNLTDITIDLDPATAGIQDSLVVAGEGTFVYDTLTGEVTFTPEVGFTTDPSVINYTLIENQTGLDSTATITITYVEEPPVAVNDEDLDNVVGTTVTLNIIENDSLSDGSLIVDLTDITIDLDPATAGIQDSLVVAGEGTFVYDTLTGEVTFTPEVGFTTDPSVINYTLIENQTGLDSTATITITYVEEPPVAVNDEDLDNVVGTTVTLNIIENDSLSDGSLIVDLTDITLDLDPATAGIQDSLVVAGEGTFVYDTLTGEVTFTPEVGFTTDPTVINYTLIENQTGLDSTATITITYVEEPPVAVNDEDLGNVVGTTVTLNIIANDSLSDGSLIVDLTDITVDLDPATAGIQDSLVVAGEGTFVYDTLTGEVTFTPEVGFTTDPSVINYTLIENQTGLDSTATITITYVEEPPVAVNDEDLDNVVGTTVTLNIIENDSLSDGSLIVDLTDITIDLDPATAGIQDSLVVAGEGTFVYDTLTGEVTFTPEDTFYGQPTPIVYELVENATGLSDTAVITIMYQQMDLSLTKEISTTKPSVGEVVVYTITVSNSGSDTVTNVYVKDYLPNGLINIDSISGGGVVARDTIVWGAFSLASGTDSVFTFKAEISPLFGGVDYENFAEISAADGFDPNSTPGNLDEIPNEDDEDVVCTFIEQFESQYELCEGGSMNLHPVGMNTVKWTFKGTEVSSGDLVLNATTLADSGSYFVTYVSSTGCTYTEEVLIIINTIPTATITGVPSECLGATVLDNGYVIVVPSQEGTTYQISKGTTFDEALGTNPTPQVIPADGVVIKDIANKVGGQNFTVRLFNSNGCSQDFVTLVPEAVCGCPAEVCVPMTFKKTKSLK
ncbi:DUF7507 domain-containing protein [Arcticibacterium luteifluviistationis]|uniref:DUF11 domain-containing protein n=1 Tax=Arcticibacterium luteifluviistationis TaxID=1784714 RepID=A0A2Z4GAQ7_9BACT|nr:DUF11 domain-containing protein [Arcticibacterium luteifluviistationis]AWV98359.1 hypothetical protein DJ013_09315 [Arcticibacterium luteifluviistationis]